MKRINLLFLLTVTMLSASVRADLLVYRESERAHVTVAGREVTLPVTTYIVYNTITSSNRCDWRVQGGAK